MGKLSKYYDFHKIWYLEVSNDSEFGCDVKINARVTICVRLGDIFVLGIPNTVNTSYTSSSSFFFFFLPDMNLSEPHLIEGLDGSS